MFGVTTGGSGGSEFGSLAGGEGGGDFDDFVLRAGVDVRVAFADVVEDVEHQGAVPRAEFVDDEVVMEGVLREDVVCDKVAGNGFAVVGAEELGRGVPELTGVIEGFLVEGVFEFGVAFSEEAVEVEIVANGGEVERFARVEDDDLFGEVAIIGVVKTVYITGELWASS